MNFTSIDVYLMFDVFTCSMENTKIFDGNKALVTSKKYIGVVKSATAHDLPGTLSVYPKQSAKHTVPMPVMTQYYINIWKQKMKVIAI